MSAAVVIDVRLTALADAIRSRDWNLVEWQYDRARSAIARELGVRERATDKLARRLPAARTCPRAELSGEPIECRDTGAGRCGRCGRVLDPDEVAL